MIADVERFFARETSDPLRSAYQGRSPVIPWLASKPVPEADIPATWENVCRTPRSGKTVAYVHVPFCTNHCLFCNFYRNSTKRHATGNYVDSVVREIEREAETEMVRSGPVHAVYLGGGTPTDLAAEDLFRLISALRRHLPLATDCEITVEGRATGCSDDKISACLDAGANRFSFGVQSFDTKVRQRLGRKMDAEQLRDFLGRVCARGRATVVCDLIFGLPDQTGESWMRDIEVAASLDLDGVDLYALTTLPASPLAAAIRKGSLPAGASLEDQASFYAVGVARLEQLGWRHLTSAHFARETRERNLYNQLVKAGASCLAYGAGAGGAVGEFSYLVAIDLARHAESTTEGKKPLAGLYRTGRSRAAKAAVTGGMEVGRLDLGHVESAVAPGFAEAVLPLVAQWERAGLLALDGTVARLTLAGRFWHTNLTSALHHLIDDTFRAGNSPSPKRPPRPPAPPKLPVPKLSQIMKPTEPIRQETQPALDALREKFAKNADGILEMIAAQSGLTTREVVSCLPESCCTPVDGAHFEAIMTDLTEWGEILFIVHTADGVFECAGAIPKGSFGRGFYNLERGSPIRGHIRAENCEDICFIRRPFMGKETCSLQFFNSHGDAMFKVFVTRNEDDSLKEDQIRRFEALRDRFQEAAVA